MKLGLIRLAGLTPPHDDQTEFLDQLMLADSLSFDLAYFPKRSPQMALASVCASTKHVKIALDASAFGSLTLRELDDDIRRVDNHLGGKLHLGVEMSCETSSAKRRVSAQVFETMFARGPQMQTDDAQTRFPMKPPCPKIIGLPVTGSSREAGLAAARGYLPLTPSWLPHREVARHWPAIVQGATSAMRRARPSHWHLARMIVVHDDPATIEGYVFGANSPIRRYYTRLAMTGLIAANVDAGLRDLVISGSVTEVAERLMTLKEQVGAFGMLHMIDPPGADRNISRGTMTLLAEQVMPMVNTIETNTPKELEIT